MPDGTRTSRRSFFQLGAGAALFCTIGGEEVDLSRPGAAGRADALAARVPRPPGVTAAQEAARPDPAPGGVRREYWIQARSAGWNVVPTGRDDWHGRRIRGKTSRPDAVPSGRRGTFAAVAKLSSCPSCASPYLQPMRCEVQETDEVIVDLRCSDCMTWLQVPFTREDMEELDRCQAQWRDEIVAAYERSVSESMEALAAILGPALALDLVGADDFAPRPRARRA